MRLFWSLFFLGSLLLLSFDVVERRQSPEETPGISNALGDPWAPPTPNP